MQDNKKDNAMHLTTDQRTLLVKRYLQKCAGKILAKISRAREILLQTCFFLLCLFCLPL